MTRLVPELAPHYPPLTDCANRQRREHRLQVALAEGGLLPRSTPVADRPHEPGSHVTHVPDCHAGRPTERGACLCGVLQ